MTRWKSEVLHSIVLRPNELKITMLPEEKFSPDELTLKITMLPYDVRKSEKSATFFQKKTQNRFLMTPVRVINDPDVFEPKK